MGKYDTFLFIPNLIDYGRVICVLITCYYAFDKPILSMIMYVLNQVLDAFDGMAARKFNQCSRLGMVLDMVCDRFSDAIFLSILSTLYPKLNFLFLFSIILDLSSHWFQTYSTIYCGEEHHKTAKTEWKLLHIYYHGKMVLFTMVLGYEMFLVNLYLKHFEHQLDVPDFLKVINNGLLIFSTPIFFMKSLISVIQLISACQKIVNAEIEKQKAVKKQ